MYVHDLLFPVLLFLPMLPLPLKIQALLYIPYYYCTYTYVNTTQSVGAASLYMCLQLNIWEWLSFNGLMLR